MRDTFLGDLLFSTPAKYGGWIEWSGFIILWIITICLSVALIWGILYVIDASFLQEKSGVGIVTGRHFSAAHTSTHFVHVGKVLVPHTTRHPDTWSICIQINGLKDWVDVSKKIHDSYGVGSSIECTYSNGRIWDSMYIKSCK